MFIAFFNNAYNLLGDNVTALFFKVYYSLTIAFLRKSDKNTVLDFSLIFDFLFGIGLTIYLIYLIPNTLTNLQTIVTAIVAAIYGGLLTLVGVAWTIRHSDKQKHTACQIINSAQYGHRSDSMSIVF